MRSSYGKVVGREEAPWWKWKRRVKSDRRVRDVWFQKQQEGRLPDRGQGGKPGLLASGLWKTAELLVVQFGSVAFHS